ncbi:lysophospholipid acyltransferase family protein [Paragemmobacter straminiformis]|uniref:Lysophospholipid acyltransferase family protein n=1 Tax=Paragemmobacter straminiformis TaxID=2045119 RepID=A0A842ID55_9RHOB|nr:lysophospholipid acyltransferase family protein [Gemmobacter straminiformis]MBC2836878.1 lysophospholipid acyltransferase family protein [Gemmobacter straminiformis]
MTDASYHAPSDPGFTYSHPGQSRFRRALIRSVERATGQPRLKSLYLNWAAAPLPDEPVFDAALRLLRITPHRRWTVPAAHIPAKGGLLLVANHPYGIVDGLALCQLAMQLRGNVQILTNAVLCQPAEVTPHLLPIDFSGTPQARKTSAQSRRLAIDLLAAGKTVAMFPAGGISTANAPLRGRAHDAEWHAFVARLATIPDVTTLPVHFAGQNSRLFQIASHLSYPLRVALVFHETRRLAARALRMTIGAPVTAAELAALPKEAIAAELRRRTMQLGGQRDETFLWPAHVKW